MKKLVLVTDVQSPAQLPESLPKQQQASQRWQGALICCALAYILCVLASTAPIYSMLGLQTQLWISLAIVKMDNWLHFPLDLGFTVDHYVSRGDTLYLEFALLMLLAFVIYGLCAYLIHHMGQEGDHVETSSRAGSFALWLIWITVIVSGCIYLFTPASSSDDVYGYASYGRLLSVHHVNPYFVSPSAFQQDPTYPLIHWKDAFAPYGPVWVVLSALVGLIAGPGRLEYLIAFRLCAFAAHLLNIWLVMSILRTMERPARTVVLGTMLYAWNPLVVLESSLGGHNDVFMLTFILLGLWLSARAERRGAIRLRDSIPALVAFTLAGLVKLTAFPILAFPVLMLCWDTYRGREGRGHQAIGKAGNHKDPPSPTMNQTWHPLNTPRATTFRLAPPLQRGGFALLAGLFASMVCVVVALAVYAPFWFGHSIQQIVVSFSSQPTENFAFNSLLAAISVWQRAHGLPAFLMLFNSRHTWNVITIVVIALCVGLGAAWLGRAPTTRSTHRGACTIALAALATLTALLLVTPWFTSWYVTWLVGLAAVCLPVASDRLARSLFVLALTFSASAFLTYYYVSIGHVLLVRHPENITWFVLVCFATFGVPVCAFLLSWVSQPPLDEPPQPQGRGQASPLLETNED